MLKAKTKRNFMRGLQTQYIALACIMLGLASIAGGQMINRQEADASAVRKARINAIYDSLKLGPEYQVKSVTIFGDKRPYSYDKGRSYSSSKEYVRDGTVADTAAQLRKAIEAAGYKYFEEPYPGSTFTEWHFKSDKNEYIRLNVSSKPRDDAMSYPNPTDNALAIDPNLGPSNVIIKVNLDDNNE